ncbi:MAG TPA: hypothetical protein VLG50_04410 [Candidatus Saccharimonadales bacterium]|nr:hypothetical protein [Candidatus Saccharimonadales bacterium]
MKHCYVYFFALFLSISHFTIYAMEPVAPPSLSPSQVSRKKASVAIANFVQSVTPQENTPRHGMDIPSSSDNPRENSVPVNRRPSATPEVLNATRPDVMNTSGILSISGPLTHSGPLTNSGPLASSGLLTNSGPLAISGPLHTDSEILNDSDDAQPTQAKNTDYKVSIRRVNDSIQALRVTINSRATSLASDTSKSDNETPATTVKSADNAPSSSKLEQLAAPAVLVVAAAYAGSTLAEKIAPTKKTIPLTRFLDPVTIGTALSGASSIASFFTSGALPVLAGAYVLYKGNQWIHADCKRDLEKLTESYEKKLIDHKTIIDGRLDTYATQIGNVLEEVGHALEDTGNALDQVATIAEHIAPKGDLSTIKAIHEQAKNLQNIGQETRQQQPKIVANSKCGGCCCTQ